MKVAVSEIRARARLADVRSERAPRLVAGDVRVRVRKVEIVVPGRVRAKRGVIGGGGEIDGCTTRPATDHACAEEVRALLRGEAARIVLQRVVDEELLELGDELLQLPERKEGSVERPRGPSDSVSVAASEDDAGGDNRLPCEDVGGKAVHSGL